MPSGVRRFNVTADSARFLRKCELSRIAILQFKSIWPQYAGSPIVEMLFPFRTDIPGDAVRVAKVLLTAAILLTAATASRESFAQETGSLFENIPLLSQDNEGGEEEHLETDRDSFTPATTVVGSGRFMFESSYSYLDNRDTADSHSFPEILTRAGITDWLELRCGWNYEAGGGGSVSGGGGEVEEAESTRESKVLYGFKAVFNEQDEWLPQTACIVQGRTPTSGPENASDFQFGYVAGWELANEAQLDWSVRYFASEEENDAFNQLAPSIVLKVPFAEQWNAHMEYFGIFTDGKADENNAQYFSPGIHYLISPNCEVGVRVGWGLNDDAANFFSNVGIGVRI